MGKIQCSNCKKKFDYDIFYGICPKCGLYNRKVSAGDLQEQFHDTKETVKEKKKGRIYLLIFLVYLSIGVGIQLFKKYEIMQLSSNITYEPETYNAGEMIPMRLLDCTVQWAKVILTSEMTEKIPKEQMLIAVWVDWDARNNDRKNVCAPLVGLADGEYRSDFSWNSLDIWHEENMEDWSYEILYDSQNFRGKQSGYYMYLVDSDMKEIRVLLQDQKTPQDRTYVTKVYEVLLPIEEVAEK